MKTAWYQVDLRTALPLVAGCAAGIGFLLLGWWARRYFPRHSEARAVFSQLLLDFGWLVALFLGMYVRGKVERSMLRRWPSSEPHRW